MNVSSQWQTVRVIDSHTGGEPTRIVVSGGPDLGLVPLKSRVERFRHEFDWLRRGIVNEPRGSDAVVGGWICPPLDASCAAGIIFFNNQGYLGMCGHGLIGLMVTLRYLKRLTAGVHRIETPVGVVTAHLRDSGEVSFENVPSYRFRTGIQLRVPEYGLVVGDIAWGGNWFFLTKCEKPALEKRNVAQLTSFALAIRQALQDAQIAGADGSEIDHIELMSLPQDSRCNGRSFVLCPGGAYDRSPCGTGTSAKLACLAADDELRAGDIWRQESIVGSVFTAHYRLAEAGENLLPGIPSPTIIPTIEGRAFICADATLIFDPRDPFAFGIDQ